LYSNPKLIKVGLTAKDYKLIGEVIFQNDFVHEVHWQKPQLLKRNTVGVYS